MEQAESKRFFEILALSTFSLSLNAGRNTLYKGHKKQSMSPNASSLLLHARAGEADNVVGSLKAEHGRPIGIPHGVRGA